MDEQTPEKGSSGSEGQGSVRVTNSFLTPNEVTRVRYTVDTKKTKTVPIPRRKKRESEKIKEKINQLFEKQRKKRLSLERQRNVIKGTIKSMHGEGGIKTIAEEKLRLARRKLKSKSERIRGQDYEIRKLREQLRRLGGNNSGPEGETYAGVSDVSSAYSDTDSQFSDGVIADIGDYNVNAQTQNSGGNEQTDIPFDSVRKNLFPIDKSFNLDKKEGNLSGTSEEGSINKSALSDSLHQIREEHSLLMQSVKELESQGNPQEVIETLENFKEKVFVYFQKYAQQFRSLRKKSGAQEDKFKKYDKTFGELVKPGGVVETLNERITELESVVPAERIEISEEIKEVNEKAAVLEEKLSEVNLKFEKIEETQPEVIRETKRVEENFQKINKLEETVSKYAEKIDGAVEEKIAEMKGETYGKHTEIENNIQSIQNEISEIQTQILEGNIELGEENLKKLDTLIEKIVDKKFVEKPVGDVEESSVVVEALKQKVNSDLEDFREKISIVEEFEKKVEKFIPKDGEVFNKEQTEKITEIIRGIDVIDKLTEIEEKNAIERNKLSFQIKNVQEKIAEMNHEIILQRIEEVNEKVGKFVPKDGEVFNKEQTEKISEIVKGIDGIEKLNELEEKNALERSKLAFAIKNVQEKIGEMNNEKLLQMVEDVNQRVKSLESDETVLIEEQENIQFTEDTKKALDNLKMKIENETGDLQKNLERLQENVSAIGDVSGIFSKVDEKFRQGEEREKVLEKRLEERIESYGRNLEQIGVEMKDFEESFFEKAKFNEVIQEEMKNTEDKLTMETTARLDAQRNSILRDVASQMIALDQSRDEKFASEVKDLKSIIEMNMSSILDKSSVNEEILERRLEEKIKGHFSDLEKSIVEENEPLIEGLENKFGEKFDKIKGKVTKLSQRVALNNEQGEKELEREVVELKSEIQGEIRLVKKEFVKKIREKNKTKKRNSCFVLLIQILLVFVFVLVFMVILDFFYPAQYYYRFVQPS